MAVLLSMGILIYIQGNLVFLLIKAILHFYLEIYLYIKSFLIKIQNKNDISNFSLYKIDLGFGIAPKFRPDALVTFIAKTNRNINIEKLVLKIIRPVHFYLC